MRRAILLGILVQLWKYLRRQLLVLHQAPQPGDEIELVVGDLLFGDPQLLGSVLVRPAPDEEELGTLQLGPFSPFAPTGDLIAEGFSDRLLLQVLSLAATGDAAGHAGGAGHFPRAGRVRSG